MAIYTVDNIPSKLKNGDIINCDYSGTAKSCTLPKGTYKLECWGAQGGDGLASSVRYSGGYGGYSIGTLSFSANTTFYIYTGGKGSSPARGSTSTYSNSGGFNGGGDCVHWSNDSFAGSGGGGASDIRIGIDSLYSRVIVAGGGGGSAFGSSGTNQGSVYAYGGGISGAQGYASGYTGGQGGTQTSGYSFGIGGNGIIEKCNGGGGGGWYGGYGANDYASGGGGSGYVYTSSTASNYPSGCLLNPSYYLTDAQTIAGNQQFPSPSGASETGHSGNGYVRITVLYSYAASLFAKLSNEWKEINKSYIKIGSEWWLINSAYEKNKQTQKWRSIM